MVLYFTGTGNSKYIAERIAMALNDDILSMNDRIKAGNTDNVMTGKSMVIVVPTYAWRIPRIVLKWLQQTKFPEAKQIWFVMDCGGEIGNAAKYNQKLSKQLCLSYMGTAQIVMPEKELSLQKVLEEHSGEEMSQEALDLMATSLYDAALYAETGISERHESETIPEYVDAGMEAVLSEEKDLKIENTTESPLYIEAYINGDEELVCTIYGEETREKERSISFKNRDGRERGL